MWRYSSMSRPAHIQIGCGLLLLWLAMALPAAQAAGAMDRGGMLWQTIEWSLDNPSYAGNPFDLIATVTFTHGQSAETRATQMFYDGNNTWKFRFTGTRTGTWTFATSSSDPDLAGFTGTITVSPNADANALGFLTNAGNKWARQKGNSGGVEAFVPQLVMYVGGDGSKFANLTDSQLNGDIQEFIVEHGFNGFHVPVMVPSRWVDGNNNPRLATFETLERIITRTHAAGGMVFLWIWGDDDRAWSSLRLSGGANGAVDRRLQRYLASRLGALPGWAAGYGFDLWEWTDSALLQQWHSYMHDHLGWPHFLSARSDKNELTQIYEGMDISDYEWHRPTYSDYIDHLNARPGKPAMSGDRFRIRSASSFPEKDYDEPMTRRGLWHSIMAGGVANIWGNLNNGGSAANGSAPYSNKSEINTYSVFWKGRFLSDMQRDNALSADSNTRVLRSGTNRLIFYREGATSIQMRLTGMSASQPAIAVDTRRPYAEIALGNLGAENQTWTAPYASDWAIAVGTFTSTPNVLPPPAPTGESLEIMIP